ncbi:uncharacterized protein BJ212DRAFT_1361581, partial [Suillus subaureus]
MELSLLLGFKILFLGGFFILLWVVFGWGREFRWILLAFVLSWGLWCIAFVFV